MNKFTNLTPQEAEELSAQEFERAERVAIMMTCAGLTEQEAITLTEDQRRLF